MRQGIRMTIGVDPGGVAEVNAAFAEFAEANAVPPGVRRSMSVALDELLANAVSHGLAGREAGEVTVEAGVDEERVTLTLTDDGPPFDPFAQEAPDTTLPVEDRPIGGLGLHLVPRLVDEVSYERRDDCNVVVLVKKLGGGQAEKDGPRGGK
jgi:anti-sigma regulatory factor (Ser/Thr protein kinase)